MKNMKNMISISWPALVLIVVVSAVPNQALAQKEIGHGHQHLASQVFGRPLAVLAVVAPHAALAIVDPVTTGPPVAHVVPIGRVCNLQHPWVERALPLANIVALCIGP